MADRPNVVFVLADQLRAASLPVYGETQIETPHLDRLAREGVRFTNMASTCPVCTPYRSMLLTGRHPQTTGHLINFVRTRHDEISLGDAFGHAGYRTAWVGKWHLHTGSFPQIDGPDYVPEGRDRLGFRFWRGYNFHMNYFNGSVNLDDWRVERWEGYETDALNRYAFEFMESAGGEPFCLFMSPHQPHYTPHEFAPEAYYGRLPEQLVLPENVPQQRLDECRRAYRHYLAMTLALDDMVGQIMDTLDRAGLADDTILVFTSDHGTQMGAHDWPAFQKKVPYEESLLVPMIARWPGVLEGGRDCDVLTAPVDIFPSLCGLCGVPVPRTVEGRDLSGAWRGHQGAFEQEAVFTMNFTAAHDYLVDGEEWRGVRTRDHSYAQWLNGTRELYDLRDDPLQTDNLAGHAEHSGLEAEMEARLADLMAARGDELAPCTSYANWFDSQRRIVRNAYGPMPDPEREPDWSLLS